MYSLNQKKYFISYKLIRTYYFYWFKNNRVSVSPSPTHFQVNETASPHSTRNRNEQTICGRLSLPVFFDISLYHTKVYFVLLIYNLLNPYPFKVVRASVLDDFNYDPQLELFEYHSFFWQMSIFSFSVPYSVFSFRQLHFMAFPMVLIASKK